MIFLLYLWNKSIDNVGFLYLCKDLRKEESESKLTFLVGVLDKTIWVNRDMLDFVNILEMCPWYFR